MDMHVIPNIKVKIPGPNAQELLKLQKANLPAGLAQRMQTYAKQGEGALLEDVDGNVFIDFAGGMGVLNIGHNHPEVKEAVIKQAGEFLHSNINIVPYETYLRLAEILNKIVPIEGPKKTFFLQSGAEADENAVKIARYYTKRTEIVAYTGAFHGRTLLGMSLTSKPKPYKVGFGPLAPGIHRIEYPYCYRCPYGLDKHNCNLHCAKRLRDFFLEQCAPEETAAIIFEPIQGEGGFVVPPTDYVVELRKVCDEFGIVLIADEVQSGICRSGKMYAFEHFPVGPDILTTAKSLGAGLPISGIVGKAHIMDSAPTNGVGGTYGGNPVACAAGVKVLEVMIRDNYAKKSEELGKKIEQKCKILMDKYECIGDIRGLGSMRAMEFVKDRETKEPMPVAPISAKCAEKGLILVTCGIRANVVRLLIPLVITDEQLEAGFRILDESIKEVLFGV
ncbi:MAG: aspartate aminotransferase family protein [Synergistaceae bacterium]|nr:aspartate aminotransferase family protein [Synergistaceae bacterium]